MRCPNCNEPLLPGSKKCGDCGWHAKKEKTETIAADHRCAWRQGDVRCPAMGTMSDSTKGGSTWFCRWHFFSRSDADCSLRIAEDMINNGVPKSDWREEIMRARMAKG